MFVKDLLTPGSFVCTVPIGMLMTLQYDENGKIQKVHQGVSDGKLVDMTDMMLSRMLKEKIIPNKIALVNGTTFIYGVLYTPRRFFVEGSLPECLYPAILNDFNSYKSSYNFFAGSVKSLSTSFSSSVVIRNWLEMSGFHTLPGFIVPSGISESIYEKLVDTEAFPFEYPLISNYLIYNGSAPTFVSTGLRQVTASYVNTRVDSGGFWMTDIVSTDYLDHIRVDYPEIVSCNVGRGSLLTVTSDDVIIHAYNQSKSFKLQEDHVVCKDCGRKIAIPKHGRLRCSYPHCRSRLYPRVKHLLSVLQLPCPDFDYCKDFWSAAGSGFKLVDIFEIDQLRNFVVKCSLPELIRAVVPDKVMKKRESFEIFCNRCNNSITTVEYYLHNPDRIIDSLCESDRSEYLSFCAWLKDKENVQDIEDFLFDEHIEVVTDTKKFEGAPIFRDKSILVTGSFIHGSRDEIQSILKSYSANVVFDGRRENFDIVVTGDTLENIDGQSINMAKESGIPIYTESEFFNKFEIDEDIKANLG